jgi:CelD/BcsL family acetyltransferase involved in cellulose biosynthesis
MADWLEFESASEKDFRELFDAVIDLHCARWNERNEPGVMCENSTSRFHTVAARALFQRGIARVYALRTGERVVAGVYALLCRDQMLS